MQQSNTATAQNSYSPEEIASAKSEAVKAYGGDFNLFEVIEQKERDKLSSHSLFFF